VIYWATFWGFLAVILRAQRGDGRWPTFWETFSLWSAGLGYLLVVLSEGEVLR